MIRCSLVVFAAIVLVSLGGCAHVEGTARSSETQTDARFPVTTGPRATQKLFEEIAEQDRNLFEIIFIRCDAGG